MTLIFEVSYPSSTEESNAKHLSVKIDKVEWLKDSSEHYTTLWKNPKSLAQDGNAQSMRSVGLQMLKALKTQKDQVST